MISHPIFLVERTAEGELVSVEKTSSYVGMATGDTSVLPVIQSAGTGTRKMLESWTSLELTLSLSEEAAAELQTGLQRVLADVAAAHADRDRLRDLARETVQAAMEMASEPGPRQASARDARDLLE